MSPPYLVKLICSKLLHNVEFATFRPFFPDRQLWCLQ